MPVFKVMPEAIIARPYIAVAMRFFHLIPSVFISLFIRLFINMFARLFISLLYTFAIAIAVAHSQPSVERLRIPPPQPFQFKHLTIQDGLSQSSVHAIVQDKHGFLWFGTEEGLNKYDGYTCKIHRPNTADSLSLSYGWITALHEDPLGRLWIGTRGGGVNVYDRATRRVHWLQAFQPNGAAQRLSSLSNNVVSAIYQDRSGALWIGTDNGVSKLEAANVQALQGEFRIFQHNSDNPRSLSGTVVYAITEDAHGTVWIGTDYGLNKYNPTTNDFERVYFEPENGSIGNMIRAITPAPNGCLWLGTFNGLGLYNPRNGTVRAFTSKGSANAANAESTSSELCHNEIRCLLRDNRGRLWIGTERGLSVLFASDSIAEAASLGVARSALFHTCLNNSADHTTLNSTTIRSLYQDRNGIVWIGTGTGGVHSWDMYRVKFPLYSNTFSTAQHAGDADKSIRAFCEETERGAGERKTGERFLWIGTDNGLLRLSRGSGDLLVFRANANSSASAAQPSSFVQSSSLLHNHVWALYKQPSDPLGSLWVGTSGGLHRLTTTLSRTGTGASTTAECSRFHVLRHNPNDSTTLTSDFVRAIASTRDGALWVGTLNGLNRIEPQSLLAAKPQCKRYYHDERNPNSINDNRATALFEDSKGILWIGTTAGLDALDPRTGVFTHYNAGNTGSASKAAHDSTATTPSSTLRSNWAKVINEDSEGTLWIGTAGGLFSFNRATRRFTRYGLEHGFANDYIYGILEDAQGFLWVSTNQGLAKFDKRSGRAQMFDENDGLQSNEFNTNAYYKTPSGELIFGGISGFNIFRPEHIRNNTVRPPIALVEFKVFEHPIQFDTDISNLRTITLSHEQNFIEFVFALLDFSNAAKKQYLYRLEGIDDGWKAVGARNFATYTNLEPGKYVFRVKGKSVDGVWSSELTIELHITPPFWKTWWFRVTIAVLMCGLVFSAYRWRIRDIELQRQVLEREVRDRTTLLQQRTHEMERTNEQMRWANEEIINKNEQLELLNEEKNEFMGIAAHDLKNPLSRIISLADMMSFDAESFRAAEVQEFAGMIASSATGMLEMVKNLLNVNAIERGALDIRIEPVNVQTSIGKVQTDYQTRADAKHIRFVVDLPAEPVFVAADAHALEQILDNLVSNAVKYSPERTTVTIGARGLPEHEIFIAESSTNGAAPLKQPEQREQIVLSVQDEGPGFSDDDKQRLFQRFARLSAKPTAGEHSTGLGLAIVKKLTEAMNGSITCESELGKGATFSLTLPRTGAQILMHSE